ncbi:MAG TPA: phosphodiesterase [Burkholderiales bacterium]|jgi:3',5'-cyclic AMP phosphodiesterase CpdA|nr:phosphodiesterase [Burkholderiales bacterium]
MLIAQITDFHVKLPGRLAYRVVDTAASLQRCVAQLRRLDPVPDVVLATGDLTDFGRPDEYAFLRELLEPLKMPVYLIPGNHDERGAFREAFRDCAWMPDDEFVQYTLEDYPLRLIALDTVVPQQGGGTLCEKRLAWLEARLAEAPQRPTLIFMHHPPFRTGIAHMDRIGLDNAEAFGRIVARHPQIEKIICGHLHRAIDTRWCGTAVSTCPSPAHQVALDLRPDGPSAFVMEPPGYQLHWWDGVRLVSHTAFIGEFDGPYPFFEGKDLID